MSLKSLFLTLKGGAGSGNWGHAGIQGHRGGSLPRSSAMSRTTGRDYQERQQLKKGNRLPVNPETEKNAENLTIKNYGSVEEANEGLEELKRLTSDASVSLRIHKNNLLKVLDSGRFMNQHESKTSSGQFDPEPRKRAEDKAFGINSSNPKDYPIYTYMSIEGKSDMVSGYGDIRIDFKNSVRDRTTITVGESLRNFGDGKLVGTPLNNPRLGSLYGSNMYGGQLNYAGYIEGQVHGGLSVKDIDKVYLPKAYRNSDLTRKLDEVGISYEIKSKVIG